MTRPPRRMLSVKRIAQTNGIPPDVCQACGDHPIKPERAHIITRVYGGLDVPCNIWLLCHPCHNGSKFRNTPGQPDFHPGQEDEAQRWLESHPGSVDGVDRLMRTIEMQCADIIARLEAGDIDEQEARALSYERMGLSVAR